ncbi:hypothetical protein V2G26_010761 [Clonostachys chloroleuca]
MELLSSYDTKFAFPMATYFQGFHDTMIMESSELQEVQQITGIGIQAPQHDPFVAQGQPVTANSLSHLNSSGSSINSYSSTPSEHGGTTSSLLNSQARTHRCDRINPTTGKPCDKIFSRLHHLTRHKDTIHNARKQEVRCNVCTEEKKFSRTDALRRHYRLCHPDIRSHSLTVPRPHDGTTSSLLNSQARTHRCDRINPTTGKPCNTIFSRSSTLNRHKKTIHNARNKKVRCTICTKDKSYSRIDTLRKHYHNYHRGIDLPSKHR